MQHESNRTVDILVDRIRPILAGHMPDIQGAVIADLLAIFLAGHTTEDGIREIVFDGWLALARDLVAMYDEQNSPKKN